MMMKTSMYMKNALLQLGHMLPSQHSGRLSVGDQPDSIAAPPAVLEHLASVRLKIHCMPVLLFTS